MIIKFAIVGCGRISEKHLTAINSCEDTRLVSVCDLKAERAKAVADKIGCKWYTDYKEMIAKEDFDIVDVCTPNYTHANIVIDFARARKHILTEKPMALNIEDCDKMITECETNGVKLFVVKQNRLNPAILKLREALDNGRFGKLILGNVTVRWSRDQAYYEKNDWHGSKQKDGGMLFTQASHHVDMLQWMLGPVHSVKAYTGTLAHNIETEDTSVVALKFKNGALGVIEATTCTFPKDMEGSITLLGSKATAKIGGFAMNKIDFWEFSDPKEESLDCCTTNPPNAYGYSHSAVIRNIVKTLKGEPMSNVDGYEGRKSIELILAIYESAKTGKEIFLD